MDGPRRSGHTSDYAHFRPALDNLPYGLRNQALVGFTQIYRFTLGQDPRGLTCGSIGDVKLMASANQPSVKIQ
ncbi:MAG: hypothetical protein M1588_01970 [Planctomycetes bacterium]|nr:hypothetical protein [Planctomycetota bacterium]